MPRHSFTFRAGIAPWGRAHQRPSVLDWIRVSTFFFRYWYGWYNDGSLPRRKFLLRVQQFFFSKTLRGVYLRRSTHRFVFDWLCRFAAAFWPVPGSQQCIPWFVRAFVGRASCAYGFASLSYALWAVWGIFGASSAVGAPCISQAHRILSRHSPRNAV